MSPMSLDEQIAAKSRLEPPASLRGLQETTDYFRFTDIDQLKKFWESNSWKPYAEHLFDTVFEPRRLAAATTDAQQGSDVDFATVEVLLETEESHGRARYSDPNFDEFLPIDHYCWAISNINRLNVERPKGLFYGGHSLTEHTRLCRIWTMLGSWAHEQLHPPFTQSEGVARERTGEESAGREGEEVQQDKRLELAENKKSDEAASRRQARRKARREARRKARRAARRQQKIKDYRESMIEVETYCPTDYYARIGATQSEIALELALSHRDYDSPPLSSSSSSAPSSISTISDDSDNN